MIDARAFYEGYYQDVRDEFRRWRLLGGVEKANSVLALTTGLEVQRVIDIGSGTGALLQLLSPIRPDWQFAALEVAPSAVAEIRALHLPNVAVTLFDGDLIPFRRHAFDLAILSHVVEHLPNPAVLIREAARVARAVIIEVPVEGTPALKAIAWLRKRTGRGRVPNALGHLQFCSRRGWDQLFADAGLTVQRRRQYVIPEEVLLFGKRGRTLLKERAKLVAQKTAGNSRWGDFYYSHYAVLAGPKQ